MEKYKNLNNLSGIQSLFIPKSQSQKYHLQNVQLLRNGKLINLHYPTKDKSLEIVEMEAALDELLPKNREYLEKSLRYPNETAEHSANVVKKFVENVRRDEEIYIDNVVINDVNISSLRLDASEAMRHRPFGSKESPSFLVDFNANISGEEICGKIFDSKISDLSTFYENYRTNLIKCNPDELIQGYYTTSGGCKRSFTELFLERSVIIKMDIYMVLPYSKEVLSEEFLEKFQNKWDVERPWRYTCVRNWILIPFVGINGTEIYNFDDVAGYVRNLRYHIYNIFKDPLNQKTDIDLYRALRKFYSYLLFIKDFHTLQIPLMCKTHDQIQFYMSKQYDMNVVEDTIEVLNEFFTESSTAFVYGLLIDLKTMKIMRGVNPRLDESFIEQTLETIRYLLEEHHIHPKEELLCEYVNQRVQKILNDLQIPPFTLLFKT